MKKTLQLLSGLALAIATLLPAQAQASFHIISIEEIFAGTSDNAAAQFVVLRMDSGGQNTIDTSSIDVYGADGILDTSFPIATDVTNSASGASILIGTAAAETLFGITSDFAMGSAAINAAGGKVCFNKNGDIDCVVYGTYTGGDGTNPAPALVLGQSLIRTSGATNDLALGAPAPRNNSDATGALPTDCGNGTVDTNEECDDGGSNSDSTADACRTDCLDAHCGDGVVDSGEACDDGNSNDSDSCENACTVPVGAFCGDGNVDGGEACDDGNDVDTDACTQCAVAACGDGKVQATVEACDDGNTTAGDGCSATCTVEAHDGTHDDTTTTDGDDGGCAAASGTLFGTLLGGLALIRRRRK